MPKIEDVLGVRAVNPHNPFCEFCHNQPALYVLDVELADNYKQSLEACADCTVQILAYEAHKQNENEPSVKDEVQIYENNLPIPIG